MHSKAVAVPYVTETLGAQTAGFKFVDQVYGLCDRAEQAFTEEFKL